MKKKKKDTSLYSKEGAESALEDDEISPEEQGFMQGYSEENTEQE